MAVEFLVDEADKKRLQRREQQKEMRVEGEVPPDLIKPDPDKHYKKVFYAPGNRGRIARFQGRGYRVTPPDSTTKIPGARMEDGLQIDGEDLVLMETSQENYKKRVKQIANRAHRFEVQAQHEQQDKLNRLARDAGLVGPGQNVAFDPTELEKE